MSNYKSQYYLPKNIKENSKTRLTAPLILHNVYKYNTTALIIIHNYGGGEGGALIAIAGPRNLRIFRPSERKKDRKKRLD